MPGGLTRVTASLDDLETSVQSGGSKDTWVIAQEPTSQFSLMPASMPRLDVSRATFDLPSRVADNIFWLGRYVERVEPAGALRAPSCPACSRNPTRWPWRGLRQE